MNHRIGGGSTALFTVNKQTDELAFLQAYVVRKSTTQTNTPFTKVSSILERDKATGNTIHPSLGILGGPLLLGPFLFLLLGNQFHPMAGTCLRWLCLSKGLNPTIR